MKLHFLKSPTGSPYFLGYSAGDEGDVKDEKLANKLIADGMAETLDQKKKREAAAKAVEKENAASKSSNKETAAKK